MNLKSYMRGLGIGIIVTAILMGIGNNKTEKISTEEANNATVLADLKELAEEADRMEAEGEEKKADSEKADKKETESVSSGQAVNVSSDSVDKISTEDDEKVMSDDTVEKSTEESTENSSPDVVLPNAGVLADDGQAPKDDGQVHKDDIKKADNADTPKTSTGEIIDITIVSGQGSDTIAKECERLGLVEEAAAFDKFLNSYGYDRKLTTGVHHIPMGSTESQIAEILTKKGE